MLTPRLPLPLSPPPDPAAPRPSRVDGWVEIGTRLVALGRAEDAAREVGDAERGPHAGDQ